MKWTNKGHQFDALGNHFLGKNIYIYGAGAMGEQVYGRLSFMNCVDAFLDANEEKQQTVYCSKPVLHPDVLYKQHEASHIVIVAIVNEKDSEEVMRRLLYAGYVKNYDFFHYKDFVPREDTLDYRDSFYLRIYCIYAQNKIWLDSTVLGSGENRHGNSRAKITNGSG